MGKGVVIALAVVGAISLAPMLIMMLGIFFLPIMCLLMLASPALIGYLLGKRSKTKKIEKKEDKGE